MPSMRRVVLLTVSAALALSGCSSAAPRQSAPAAAEADKGRAEAVVRSGAALSELEALAKKERTANFLVVYDDFTYVDPAQETLAQGAGRQLDMQSSKGRFNSNVYVGKKWHNCFSELGCSESDDPPAEDEQNLQDRVVNLSTARDRLASYRLMYAKENPSAPVLETFDSTVAGVPARCLRVRVNGSVTDEQCRSKEGVLLRHKLAGKEMVTATKYQTPAPASAFALKPLVSLR